MNTANAAVEPLEKPINVTYPLNPLRRTGRALVLAGALLASLAAPPMSVLAQVVPYADSYPYLEGFEGGRLDALGAEWEFQASGGEFEVTDAFSPPEEGACHLSVTAKERGASASLRAILHLDLASQSGVTLDFGTRRNSSQGGGLVGVSVRAGSSANWRSLGSWSPGLGAYEHWNLNLDPIVASAGWAYTTDFQIRLSLSFSSPVGHLLLDNLRVQVEADVVGPRVLSLSPTELAPEVAAFDTLRLSFDSSLALDSLELDDLRVWRPDGQRVEVQAIEPVPDSQNRQFEVTLAEPQRQRGTYQLTVGPELRDERGNLMNQDQDVLNGEAADGFSGTIRFQPTLLSLPASSPVLYHEGFEDWSEPPPHWALQSAAFGTILAVDSADAPAGSRHLVLGGSGTESATLAVSASHLGEGESLYLDFSAKVDSLTDNALRIQLSGDGVRWSPTPSLDRVKLLRYRGYRLNLKELAALNGIDPRQGIWIRFEKAPATSVFLDEIRVTSGQPSLWVEIEPRTVPESAGAGGAIGVIHRLNVDDVSSALEVDLASSEPAIVLVPSQVSIGTNDLAAMFFIGTADAGLPSGAREATISASAVGFQTRSSVIQVGEATTPRLAVWLSVAELNEASAGQRFLGRVDRDRGFDTNLTVQLTSSNPREVRVPASLSMPAGARRVEFMFEAANDGLVDGSQTVQVIANAPGYAAASAAVTVLDDDTEGSRTLGGQIAGALPLHTYTVTSDLLVPQDETLTIQAGARLLFRPATGLAVDGSLVAQGQGTAPIVFSSALGQPERGSWEGIDLNLNRGSSNVLDGVEIAYGVVGLDVWGDRGRVGLVRSEVHHHSYSGVKVSAWGTLMDSASVSILQNRIGDNRFGVVLSSRTSWCDAALLQAEVSGNDIYQNDAEALVLEASGSTSSGCSPTRIAEIRGVVSGNFIHHNGAGITVVGAPKSWASGGLGRISAAIVNNLIQSNRAAGVVLEGNFFGVAINNTILGNAGPGVESDLVAASAPELRNNLLLGNGAGVSATTSPTNRLASVAHNNVYGNATNWLNYPDTFGLVTTNNQRGTPSDAFMNTSIDPQFLAAGDFHLDPRSPLVDAGATKDAPQGDYDGDLRLNVPDIGCDETPYTFTGLVTTLTDEQDGFLGAGEGDSLREAMIAAALLRGPQAIRFAPSLGGDTLLLAGTPLPTIEGELTISGPGAEALFIDGNGKTKVFEIAPDSTVQIAGLTVRGGLATGWAAPGGGILNHGRLALRDCRIESCRASGGPGGGLANTAEGFLRLDRCVVQLNTAASGAAGLLNYGAATIHDSLFTGNGASGGNGGGILNQGGVLLIERSTLDGNRAASGWGGGVHSTGRLTVVASTFAANQAWYGGALALSGQTTLANCTLSGNETLLATGGGGAARIEGGRILLVHCTVTSNRVTGRYFGGGGGLHVTGETSAVTLQNTILAGNTTALTGADSSPLANLLALSGVVQQSGLSNLIGGEPSLGPLQDNGGPTLTHLPLPGSPAIDAGANGLAIDAEGALLTTDQRGFARLEHGRVDIGAVETPSIDRDRDGLPNDWETAHGLNPDDSNDAHQDADRDGATNSDEYWADTDPADPSSCLRILTIRRLEGAVEVSVTSSANRVYTLQHRPELDRIDWSDVAGSSQVLGNGAALTLRHTTPALTGFYRVRVAVR